MPLQNRVTPLGDLIAHPGRGLVYGNRGCFTTTWPEFGALHPFAPREQTKGYHALFQRLEKWLCDITGYDAISLQPNSGAQGEYAGLLAIRGYHAARGQRLE